MILQCPRRAHNQISRRSKTRELGEFLHRATIKQELSWLLISLLRLCVRDTSGSLSALCYCTGVCSEVIRQTAHAQSEETILRFLLLFLLRFIRVLCRVKHCWWLRHLGIKLRNNNLHLVPSWHGLLWMHAKINECKYWEGFCERASEQTLYAIEPISLYVVIICM